MIADFLPSQVKLEFPAGFGDRDHIQVAEIGLGIYLVQLAHIQATEERKSIFPVENIGFEAGHISRVGFIRDPVVGINEGDIGMVFQVLVKHKDVVIGEWLDQHPAA